MDRPAVKPALVLNGEGVSGREDLATSLADAGIEVVFRNMDELTVNIGSDGVKIRETRSGRDLAEFGMVQVMGYRRGAGSLMNVLADYLDTNCVPSANVNGVGAPTRLFKYGRLANRGLPILDTAYLPPHQIDGVFASLAEQLDLPFVLKSVAGGDGQPARLVSSEATLLEWLDRPGPKDQGLIAQELIPPDGFCFVLVFGGHASLSMCRSGDNVDDVINGFSWDEAEDVHMRPLDRKVQEIAERAAAALEYDVAGVHMVKHWATQLWYVSDVSPNPAISGGRYAAERVGAYCAYLRRRLAQSALSRSW